MCVWTSQSANQAGSEGDKISRSLTQSTERLQDAGRERKGGPRGPRAAGEKDWCHHRAVPKLMTDGRRASSQVNLVILPLRSGMGQKSI